MKRADCRHRIDGWVMRRGHRELPLYLIDTHLLLWYAQDAGKLRPRTREIVDRCLLDGDIGISAISFWEVGMRVKKRQLELGLDPREWRAELIHNGLLEILIDGRVACRAAALHDMHGDPSDRIIVATALEGEHRLVTADRRILEWSGELCRVDARR